MRCRALWTHPGNVEPEKRKGPGITLGQAAGRYLATKARKRTIEADRRLAKAGLSKRELTRKLHTSATQLYRLLDPTNTKKSLGQMVALLRALDCDVELIVKKRAA